MSIEVQDMIIAWSIAKMPMQLVERGRAQDFDAGGELLLVNQLHERPRDRAERCVWIT